jgi:hypothetical protein
MFVEHGPQSWFADPMDVYGTERRLAMNSTAAGTPEKFTPEKFTLTDLSSLREELLQSGLDSWQAAELISSFLSVRGYGVSNHAARGAASRIESVRCSLQSMQEELEKLALVM